MVQAIINIEDQTNRVIVKAKFGLKDKSEAIDMMATQYEESILEPEYIEKANKIMNHKKIYVGTVSNLRKRLNI